MSSRPEQGNADARVLQRVGLGMLSRWLPSAQLCEVLVESERMHERDRKLPAPAVMWLLVAAAMFRAVGLARVLRTISADADAGAVPAGSGAVSQACGRMGAAPLALLAERVLGPIAGPDTLGAFYAGCWPWTAPGSRYPTPGLTSPSSAGPVRTRRCR